MNLKLPKLLLFNYYKNKFTMNYKPGLIVCMILSPVAGRSRGLRWGDPRRSSRLAPTSGWRCSMHRWRARLFLSAQPEASCWGCTMECIVRGINFFTFPSITSWRIPINWESRCESYWTWYWWGYCWNLKDTPYKRSCRGLVGAGTWAGGLLLKDWVSELGTAHSYRVHLGLARDFL